jgi:hypothetical protein
MPAPREIVDALESVLGVYFSDIRHRARASFILCDEMVEMACKLRARQANHNFNMSSGFHAAWNAPHVAINPHGLGERIQANRNTRNTLQHQSATATVDDQHCADAILDGVDVIDHCWHESSQNDFRSWMKCALRVVRLQSSHGDGILRQEFEDELRREPWRNERRQPRVHEIIIAPGRRTYWQLLFTQSQAQVESILARLGVP